MDTRGRTRFRSIIAVLTPCGHASSARHDTRVPDRVRILLLVLVTAVLAGIEGLEAQSRRPARPAADEWKLQPSLEISLDMQPAAPAAFDQAAAYLPLRGERLVAVDFGTGRIRWSADIATTWAPAVSDGIVVVATGDALIALDSACGRLRWRIPVPGGFSAPPSNNQGWVVAAAATGDLLAARAADGGVIWTRALGSPARVPVVLTPAGVFASLADGRVVALALQTGASTWERPLPGAPGPLLVFDDRVFLGADDKFFYALDARSGRVRWRQRVGGRPAGPPAADARHVYYVALDNILWAFDRGNGGRKWHTPLPMRPSGGPLVMGDRVVVAGVAAEMRAFLASTGEESGRFEWPADLAAAPQLIPGPLPALSTVALVTRTGVFTLLSRLVEPRATPLSYPLGTLVPLSALDPGSE